MGCGGLDHLAYTAPQELPGTFLWVRGGLFQQATPRIETVNDLDGEIVNLFRVIREQPDELTKAVALTPYSREEYDRAWGVLRDSPVPDNPVERARLTLVRYWQTHGSCSRYKSGWKNDRAGREYAYAVRYWNQLPEWIWEVVSRLKDAQIEQGDAVDVIKRFRSPDVLVYADPPYLGITRKPGMYRVEMDGEKEHEALLGALLAHPGPVMLSGYDNELYNDMLPEWEKVHHAAQCEKGGHRTETLWVNFEIQMKLAL